MRYCKNLYDYTHLVSLSVQGLKFYKTKLLKLYKANFIKCMFSDPRQKQKLAKLHCTETSFLMRQVNKLKMANKKYTGRLKRALNLSMHSAFQKALKKFTSLALIFTLLQYREINKKKMYRWFTKKIMALALYKQSPKAYRWLIRHVFVLSSPLTLSRLLSTANLKPGKWKIFW